jgi:hypothetical protein
MLKSRKDDAVVVSKGINRQELVLHAGPGSGVDINTVGTGSSSYLLADLQQTA